jgi:3-oxoacyl-[acyl-carrier protein] reductase
MTATRTPRVVIVTGAARGIGAATAGRLARDGYAVAIFDLDESGCAKTVAAVEEEGGTALALRVEITDGERVQAAVGRVATELGALRALVNNGGRDPGQRRLPKSPKLTETRSWESTSRARS